jgi:putative transposase
MDSGRMHDMTERVYRYRFYPTSEQEQLLRRTLGCVRLVYNKALHIRTEGWYERQERIDYKQTSAMLTNWKQQEDLQFLNEVSSVPLQQGLRNLQKGVYQLLGRVVLNTPTLRKSGVVVALSLPVQLSGGRMDNCGWPSVLNPGIRWSRTSRGWNRPLLP